LLFSTRIFHAAARKNNHSIYYRVLASEITIKLRLHDTGHCP